MSGTCCLWWRMRLPTLVLHLQKPLIWFGDGDCVPSRHSPSLSLWLCLFMIFHVLPLAFHLPHLLHPFLLVERHIRKASRFQTCLKFNKTLFLYNREPNKILELGKIFLHESTWNPVHLSQWSGLCQLVVKAEVLSTRHVSDIMLHTWWKSKGTTVVAFQKPLIVINDYKHFICIMPFILEDKSKLHLYYCVKIKRVRKTMPEAC